MLERWRIAAPVCLLRIPQFASGAGFGAGNPAKVANFRHTKTGAAESLLPQKKILITVGSGGIYSDGPMQQFEHAGNYLTAVFGFLGMKDISIIRAEGLAMGPEMAEQGIARAITHAVNLAAG